MKKYFLIVDKTQTGPYTFDELKEKKISKESLIWAEGMENWVEASTLENFHELIHHLPPPIPEQIVSENITKTETYNEKSIKPMVATELKSIFRLVVIGFFVGLFSFPLFYFFIYEANKYDDGRLFVKSDVIYGVDIKDIEEKFIYWQDIKNLGCDWVIENRKQEILETSFLKSLLVFTISFGILLMFRYISKGTKWIDDNSK